MRALIKKIDKIILNNFKFRYQKYLVSKANNFLNGYPRYEIFDKKNNKNYFTSLCNKYESDKASNHFYASFYDHLFKNKKENIKLVFECGIGTTNRKIASNIFNKGKTGASAKAFKDYFINAQIFIGDIDKNTHFNEERIKSFYLDQRDKESIDSMWFDINKVGFDLIIDDGSHTFISNFILFINSFSKLKKGGFYIIEDVHVAYLEKLVRKLDDYKPKVIGTNNLNSIDDYLVLIEKY